MSLIKANAVQVGQSPTATQNFTLAVPSSPDGTIKLARGNAGATTQDVLSVDASGNINGLVKATGSTTARSLENRFADVVNVKDFGAVGDGVTDDTAAINLALDFVSTTRDALFFPSGNYIYNGAGHPFSGINLNMYGEGNKTTINLGATSYFIDTNTIKESIDVFNLSFYGGYGFYRSTFTGTEVGLLKKIEGCVFLNYTKCAIEGNSQDSPTWNIMLCTFRAVNSTSTIGIALPRWSDTSQISFNSFENNRIHIKCQDGGVNTVIENNFFGQFSAGTAGINRIAVWLEINSAYNPVTGRNCTILNNKFGNENIAADDYQIVYSEELSGTYNADRFPNLATDSSAYSLGCNAYANCFLSSDSFRKPAIYSTSPNILGLRMHGNQFPGSTPTYFIEYKTAPIGAESARESNLISGNAILSQNLGSYTPVPVSNGVNCAFYIDETFSAVGNAENIYPHTGGSNDPADFVSLYTSRGAAIGIINGSILSTFNDSTGDYNAAIEASLLDNGAISCNITIANIIVGYPTWIEFDLKSSGATPPSYLVARIASSAGNFLKRKIIPETSWVRYRFPFWFSRKDIAFSFQLLNDSGSTKTFSVGRIRVYHAKEPMSFGRSTFEQFNMSNIPTSSTNLASGSIWRDVAGGNVIKIVP